MKTFLGNTKVTDQTQAPAPNCIMHPNSIAFHSNAAGYKVFFGIQALASWPLMAAFSGAPGTCCLFLGTVLGLTLFALIAAQVIQNQGIGMVKSYAVVIVLQLITICSIWFLFGLPQWANPFLQWLGVILTQIFIGVPLCEWLAENNNTLNDADSKSNKNKQHKTNDKSRKLWIYLLFALIVIILTVAIWLLQTGIILNRNAQPSLV